MSKDFPQIIPSQPPEVEEVFEAAHLTREYYDEVQIRLEHKKHCDWYHGIAAQNRKDLEKMRGELNIFAWFRRQ
jgi:hypothetical protein